MWIGKGWSRDVMPKGYYDPKGFTEQDLEHYKEITFRNMVQFYKDELVQLVNGEHAKHILTKGDRRVLRRLGIVKLKGGGYTGRRLTPTTKTEQLLRQITT